MMSKEDNTKEQMARELAELRQRLAQAEKERAECQEAQESLRRNLERHQRQRELLENMLRGAPAGIAVLEGAEHRYVISNPVYDRIASGKGPIVGRTVAKVFPELIDQVGPLLDNVYQTGKPNSVADAEFYVVHNGHPELTYYTFSYTPLFDEERKVYGILVLVLDTTQQVLARKRIEEIAVEAERNRAFLQAILDQMPSGVFIADAPSGKLILGNEQATRIWRHPFIPAQNVEEYKAYRGFHPDGRRLKPEEWPMARALKGEVVADEVIRIERGDGTYAWTSQSAAPIKDHEGRIIAAVAVLTDITERRQAEVEREQLLERLQTANQQLSASVVQQQKSAEESQRRAAELRAIIESMVDAVFVVDEKGRVTLTNEAGQRLLGLKSIRGRKPSIRAFPEQLKMRHKDGKPVLPADMPLAAALAGETVQLEDDIFHNPQTHLDIYVRTSAAPIRDEHGAIVGAVAVAKDVSEIIALDRMKDDFIRVAAHELRTPVAIMKGYAQALEKAAERISPERRHEMVEAIDHGADRITGIVEDLLDISQLQVGNLRLARERVDLAQVAKDAIAEMKPLAGRHEIRLVKAEPAMVTGDRERLEQVIVQLLENAVKFSPASKPIDVAVERRDGEAVVSVMDYGVGIPREKQAHIFERFYRAHTGTAYDYGGMGIGLYISREIIEELGGRMWFESEEGKGSAFHFSLPLA
jgi:PAS domain S-box-containing protein